MAGTTIDMVLGAEVLLGATKIAAEALPSRHLPPKLLQGRPVGSNTGYVMVGQGTNQVAKQAHRGSAARPITLSGMSRRPEMLLHSSNSIEIKADTLVNLVNPANGQVEQFAKAEVAREVNECTKRSVNLRNAAITSLFGLGKVWFDINGDILPSSSNAVVTIDPGIPANNLNQANSMISASWETASTPIMTNLQNIQKQHLVNAKGRCGPIEHAIYGLDLFNYIYNNTQAQAMIQFNPVYQAAFAQGVIPQGFAGIKNWWPGYLGFYNNASDSTVTPFAADTLALFPEPDGSWYDLQEGVQPIPSGNFGSAADLNSLAANITIANGMFTYAFGTLNPVGGTMVFGDNFLPAIHIPECVWVLDVKP